MYYETFGQLKKQLKQLDTWFEAATAFAKEKSFNPDVFVDLRLAPDQFAFARQVQIACDTAKLGASRLTGKEAPSHADTETTIEQLRERVRSVVAYLDTFTAKDFESSATRSITQPRWEGKTMTGADYFLEHVVPNFYFHLTHVYAILRNNGVNVGKRDFLGALTQKAPALSRNLPRREGRKGLVGTFLRSSLLPSVFSVPSVVSPKAPSGRPSLEPHGSRSLLALDRLRLRTVRHRFVSTRRTEISWSEDNHARTRSSPRRAIFSSR